VVDDPKHPWADEKTSPERGNARTASAPLPEEEPRFDDRGELAVGGTSTIRHVFDRRIRRHAAMKVIDPLMASWPEAARLLVEEAQITGQLDHPNIVPVHDLGVTVDGTPMFVMKLIAGRTLSDIIREDHRSFPRMVQMFLKVCDAVAFAHSRGVIHRDIKPDNVMIGSHGQVYVMDWGCAQLVHEGKEDDDEFGGKTRVFEPPVELDAGRTRVIDGTGTVIGTGAYMAPEQAWGRTKEIDERTDVFALGAVLYQMLTRQAPFKARNHLEAVQLAQQGAITPPHEAAPDEKLPRELCRIAMKALERDPARRYQTVEHLQGDVENFLIGGHHFETRVFPAGAVVMREGEQADAAYFVVSGRCEAFRTEGDQRVTLRTMGPGEVFGETALLTSGSRTASVVALEELYTQVVTPEALEDELRAGSWLATMVKALAERFREVDEKLAEARSTAATSAVRTPPPLE
jgi:serine/threonine-protein kinase